LGHSNIKTTERYIVEDDSCLMEFPTNLTNYYERTKHDDGEKVNRFITNKRKENSVSGKIDKLEKYI
jgi:hypothetical protein